MYEVVKTHRFILSENELKDAIRSYYLSCGYEWPEGNEVLFHVGKCTHLEIEEASGGKE